MADHLQNNGNLLYAPNLLREVNLLEPTNGPNGSSNSLQITNSLVSLFTGLTFTVTDTTIVATWTTAAGLTGLTLATVPRAGTLVKLFRNRLLQVPTNDYTISGASITFNGFTSNNGDVFYALYYQAA